MANLIFLTTNTEGFDVRWSPTTDYTPGEYILCLKRIRDWRCTQRDCGTQLEEPHLGFQPKDTWRSTTGMSVTAEESRCLPWGWDLEEHILQRVIPKFPMEPCSSRTDAEEEARDSWPVVTQNTAPPPLFGDLGSHRSRGAVPKHNHSHVPNHSALTVPSDRDISQPCCHFQG